MGPDTDMLINPSTTTTYADGKTVPVGADSSLKTWQATSGRSAAARRGVGTAMTRS